MLRNFIATLILTITSVSAFANGYCNGKPTYQERQACLRAASTDMFEPLARQAIDRMNQNIATLKRDLPATPARAAFFKQLDAKRQNIDAQCKTNECVARSVGGLNNEMVAFYNANKK